MNSADCRGMTGMKGSQIMTAEIVSKCNIRNGKGMVQILDRAWHAG